MLDAGMPSVCNAETADGAARGWRLIGRYSWGNRGEPDPAVQANLPEAMRIPQGVDTGNCLFVPVDKFWGEVMPALHRLAASRQNASQSPPAPVQLAGPRTYGDDGLSLLVGPDSAPFGTATFAEDQEYMYGRVLVSRSATGPVEGVKAFIWYTGYCNGFAESFVGGQRVCQPLGQAVEPGQPGAAEAMAAMGDADLASWFASQPFECRRVAVEGAARAPEPELLRRLRSLGLVFAPPAVVRGTAPQVTPPGPAPQSWRPCISPVGFLSALQAARQALKVDVGTPPPPTDSSYPTWFLSAEAKVNSAMQGPSTSACELLSLVTSDPRLLPSWLATDAIDPDFLGSLPAAELGMLTALLDICMAAAGGDPAPVGRLIDRAGLLAAAADEFQSDAEWSGILLAAYLPLIARCGGSLRTSRMPGSEGALLEAALRGPPPARYQKGMPDPVALPRFKETVDAVRAMDPSWDWAASKGFWLRAPSAMPSPGPEPGEQLLLGSLADSVLVLSACGWAESAARNQTGDPIAAAAPVNAVIRSLADDYGCRSSLPSADTATVAVVGLVVRGQQPGAADPPWKAGLDAFIGAAMSD
ncbi:hypothetical protein DFJ74DRAFT_393795 [Hyaloraphidium curvatum]|nr:hypothetical protein DFJ74DRAFT_393795 [Hyaloraphidium curvatum]